MSEKDHPAVVPHPVLAEYYDEADKRRPFVRDLFDAAAPWYEPINKVLSFGSGDRYRREALTRHGLQAGMKVLDLATGTGVVARAARDVCGSEEGHIGLDASIGMLLEARQTLGLPLVKGSGDILPFRDGVFDMVTIGFALRHFADLTSTFAEIRRVLAPGGRLLALEITPPTSRAASAFLGFYMGRVVPLAVRLWTRDDDAVQMMKYYWDTTRTCVPPGTILDAMSEAGLSNARREVQFGSFSEYVGERV
jgi:demethylmenaquinone methyltransferase/2-methoxy-6-polyprenyl-1,4-benzoquinol methylase